MSRLSLLCCLFASVLLAACPSGGVAGPASAPEVGPSQAAAEPLAARLRAHVRFLSEKAVPRDQQHPDAYEMAADYVAAQLLNHGYQLSRPGYATADGRAYNLVFEKPGSAELVVAGAHLDAFGGYPGADDNASGVAALIELGRALADRQGGRSLQLVFFANEEPPYFHSSEMGSVVYARQLKAQGAEVAAMFSLETMGYYSDQDGSQKFPPGVEGFPSRGNFLAFVSDHDSEPLLQRSLETFRRSSSLPAEALAAAGDSVGIGWSDQWSFWQQGYPGVMVTDTALFRNPNYHTARDTFDTLDFERLALAVEGLTAVVAGELTR